MWCIMHVRSDRRKPGARAGAIGQYGTMVYATGLLPSCYADDAALQSAAAFGFRKGGSPLLRNGAVGKEQQNHGKRKKRRTHMHGIIYLVGVIVVILAILSLIGLA